MNSIHSGAGWPMTWVNCGIAASALGAFAELLMRLTPGVRSGSSSLTCWKMRWRSAHGHLSPEPPPQHGAQIHHQARALRRIGRRGLGTVHDDALHPFAHPAIDEARELVHRVVGAAPRV